ncbi:hypothetical protein ES703_86029 [subsurface metagenome]
MSPAPSVRYVNIPNLAVGFFFDMPTITLNPMPITQVAFGTQQLHYYIRSLLWVGVSPDGQYHGLTGQAFESRPGSLGGIDRNPIDFEQILKLLAFFLIQLMQSRAGVSIPGPTLINFRNAIVSLVELEVHTEIAD